jgi:hypothetical protein
MLKVSELIPVLQVAIGPVILISGVGLLLLTMTNRFGRVIDRARILAGMLHEVDLADPEPILKQINIMSCRARLLRVAIILGTISVLLAAILVIVLFFTALLRLEAAWLIGALFIGCMAALIYSLVEFIRDLNYSLLALQLELGEKKK